MEKTRTSVDYGAPGLEAALTDAEAHEEHEVECTEECPACGGEPALLGVLGNLTWFRCRACGHEFSRKA